MRVYGTGCCFTLRLATEVWRPYQVFGIDRQVILSYAINRRGSYSALVWREVRGFPQISRLSQVLSRGALVDVAPSGDLQAEITYDSPPSSESHTEVIPVKIVEVVFNGRAWR